MVMQCLKCFFLLAFPDYFLKKHFIYHYSPTSSLPPTVPHPIPPPPCLQEGNSFLTGATRQEMKVRGTHMEKEEVKVSNFEII